MKFMINTNQGSSQAPPVANALAPPVGENSSVSKSGKNILNKLSSFGGKISARITGLASHMNDAVKNRRLHKTSEAHGINSVLKNSAAQFVNDARIALDARKIVLNLNIPQLEALGAGELTRLAHIISLDNTPENQIIEPVIVEKNSVNLEKILVLQDAEIESKLQTAFGRAFNSTTINPGAKGLDKLLIDKHSTLAEGSKPISENMAVEICDYILETQGKDLDKLSRSELNYIGNNIYNAARFLMSTETGLKAFQIIGNLEKSADDKWQMRLHKSQHSPVMENQEVIHHRTTLFATIHTKVAGNIRQDVSNRSSKLQKNIQDDLSRIFVQAVHNHIEPQDLKKAVLSLFRTYSLSPSCFRSVSRGIDTDIARFIPSENLGRQMESPLAKKLENEFAASVVQNPTPQMREVGQKMIAQLQTQPEYYESLMLDYLDLKHSYVYPIAQKENLSPQDVRHQIETGSNLALVMDFNHYASDRHMKAPYIKDTNSGEITHTQHQKTYMENVSKYRGERLPLPRLTSLENKQTAIGIGTNVDALHLTGLNVNVDRPSSIKVAFGRHAEESAQADVAQGCGTTGRGNIHMWGQAAINQWTAPHLQMNENETRVYLTMLAAVMTVDGGHTLSETLGTAFIASRTAGSMSAPAQELVSGLFDHMRSITEPMVQPETRFNQFDMIFRTVQDRDMHNRLTEIWQNAL